MTKESVRTLLPVVKWAGGKRWLSNTLRAKLGSARPRIIEPFVGGGAFFFSMRPEEAILADSNSDLINAYTMLRDRLSDVCECLSTFKNNSEAYYLIRDSNPICSVERAARFLYLCRHSFNGIYRVNQNGFFNVPYGHKSHRDVFDRENLADASAALAKASLHCQDFESTIELAGPGDFVYADPPYTVAHNNNGFVKYNEIMFSYEDQRRLAKAAAAAVL
ncbi:MAG: DNA adenine methylase, partial [Fimbriimonadaceae bacterium]